MYDHVYTPVFYCHMNPSFHLFTLIIKQQIALKHPSPTIPLCILTLYPNCSNHNYLSLFHSFNKTKCFCTLVDGSCLKHHKNMSYIKKSLSVLEVYGRIYFKIWKEIKNINYGLLSLVDKCARWYYKYFCYLYDDGIREGRDSGLFNTLVPKVL